MPASAGAPPLGTPPAPGAPAEERRGALKALVAIGGLAYAGALAVPAATFLAGPAGAAGSAGGRERWVRVGRLADIPPGEPRRLQVIGDERDAFTVAKQQLLGSVWVLREGEKVRALSATCPHLGCAIDVNEDKKSFNCPCHASRFSLTGVAETGPSPRPMDPLAARVVDGWVEIDFRRYREGTAALEEISG
ncbi:ubiquinol-cytochrome c reductase iron-sulfur subunit [Sorangium cellulosum]|uniref:QcrA and Rieske domain-containing protein n=1 Tax=Sorangium cellulosum TaxID=56 RepID=UPI001F248A78|nr:Rieske (2Fe-2S) protein [Sorangium cellulosum]